MDSLLDVDTVDEVAAALRDVYARARAIAAPRMWARMQSLVAVDDAEQTISDEEWEDLIVETDDAIGDAVLDGAVAGSVSVGAAVASGLLISRITEHLTTLAKYSPTIRAKLDRWIETSIAKEPPESLEALLELLATDSPLSPDKADLVAGTEAQSAGNAGIHAALDSAPPAALRWVSQRDTRVRFEHAVADSETIPYGQDFNIGGYPARYPGDPQLPFALRVNCRCELAYVEGSEARRALGATKAELRTKASELDIHGRSTMNKGQLQHAVLKALCLQGLAGGPDCPDKLDQMNRVALLTLARGQGITGRHRMSRQGLLAALRGELHGTDAGRLASGYVRHGDFSRAVKRATGKRRRLPDQDGSGVLPSLAARRSARRGVFDEFEQDGVVPCVHCGLAVHWNPREGLAMLVPEPIVPWSEGGTLDLTNLLPSCPSCFRARGGRGLTAADVPRDAHGKWCKGAQCSAVSHEVRASTDPKAAFLTFVGEQARPAQDDNEITAHAGRMQRFEESISIGEREAWDDYQDWAYQPINRGMRYGEWSDDELPVDRLQEHAALLQGTFATHGDAGPQALFRGQSSGRKMLMNAEVGDVYQDNGFGSWTAETGTALTFTGAAQSSFNADRPHPDTMFVTMRGGSMIKSIPGTPYEYETIMPPGVRYEVTRIVDFVPSGKPDLRFPDRLPVQDHHRYIEVELTDV